MPELTVNHSPEPWALHSGKSVAYALFEVQSGEDVIALILCDEDQPVTPLELANAALINAAPRLLRVLRQLLTCPDVCPMDEETIAREAAIRWKLHGEAKELLADLQKAGVF